MCGICGVAHFSDKPVARTALERSCVELRHRGPDHTDTWVDVEAGGAVGLGATRLAVIDPLPACNQPMHDPSGRFHLAFNGEIYNFREVRRELIDAGEKLTTDGDTEVVLTACARWDVDALARFNGMWAIAFYDSQTRTGFLSRDRFGIKPLFYRVAPDGLYFANELGALEALGAFDRSIDPQALTEHLQFGYIAQPKTIFKAVRRLEPGHCLRFHASGVEQPTRYYRLPTISADGDAPVSNRCHRPPDYGDTCVNLRRRLADAVVARRVSDVPIGAFLSGGLDSSIVVAHLAAASGRPAQTFSVGYADERKYDETAYARIVADAFGTEHHELIVTQQDALEAIPRILDHLGEPVGDSSIVPTSLVSQFARQHVTVALSGDGGDELFGGYWRYLGHDTLAAYQRIPGFVRRLLVEPALGAMSSSRSSALANRVRQFRKLIRTAAADHLVRHVAWSRILAPEVETLFLDHERAQQCDHRLAEIAQQLTAGLSDADELNRILAFDLQYQLPADMLQKVDLASMMHSLEIRVPFLDYRVVEFAAPLPGSFKIDRGLRKRILMDAYRGRLPDIVLDRSKQGFEVPIGEFLRGPLREMFSDTVTRDVVESFGLLSYDGVETILSEHLARRADHADLLFALLSLCWWQRRKSRF
ncbi:MAG: asparagine synthase (glutamine-hydrolyzing) [Planctomycetota bacterium]